MSTKLRLKLFCSVDANRPNLAEPYSTDRWTFASDGKIAVRVPRRSGVQERKDAPTEMSLRLFAMSFRDNPRLQALKQINLPDEWEICPECGGTGMLTRNGTRRRTQL